MKECNRCHESKPIDQFYRMSRYQDGRQIYCKVCMRGFYSRTRAKKPEHYNRVQQDRRRRITQQIREWKVERGCLKCEERTPECLELHHLDHSEKEHNPSELSNHSMNAFLKEAEKCVVLCANCHRKVHAGYFGV